MATPAYTPPMLPTAQPAVRRRRLPGVGAAVPVADGVVRDDFQIPGTPETPGTPGEIPPSHPTGIVPPQTTPGLPPTSYPPTVTPPVAPPVTPTTPRLPRPSLVPVGTSFAQDRRYQNIDPTDSSRLTGARSAADAAATRSAGFDPRASAGAGADDAARRLATPDVNFHGVDTDVGVGPAVDPSVGADLATFRQKQMDAANKLTDGPSRSALAQREMAAFDASGAQGVKDLQRDVTQRASVDGRIGMGETTLEMTKPYTDYLLAREGKQAELASRVAGEEVTDRQNTLSATRGLVGDQYNQDAGTRGEARTERSNVQDVTGQNIARRAGERNTALGVDENNINRQAEIRRSALNAGLDMANIEGSNLRSGADTLARREAQIGDDEAANRGELRGEREVQNARGREATEDQVRQFLLEQGMEDSEFNRQLAIAQLANGGNPSGAVGAAAGNASRQAADSYAALQEMFRNRYGSTG